MESEIKYLGSPITTLPKLDKNPELEDQAVEIFEELMTFSLEDQEEGKVKYCLISAFPYSFNLG